jgi:hypothetical protein
MAPYPAIKQLLLWDHKYNETVLLDQFGSEVHACPGVWMGEKNRKEKLRRQ